MSSKKLFIYINVSVLIIYIVYANSRSKTHVTKFSNTYTWTEGFKKCEAYNGFIISHDDLKLAVSTCSNFNFDESVWINDIMFTTPALSIIGCFEVKDLNVSHTVDYTSVGTVYTLCNVSCFAISNFFGYCMETCISNTNEKRQKTTFCHGTNASRNYATVYAIQIDADASQSYNKSFNQEQYLILECHSLAGRYELVSEWWTRSLLEGVELRTLCDLRPHDIKIVETSKHRSWSSVFDECVIATASYIVTRSVNNATLCSNSSEKSPIWTGTRTYKDIISEEEYQNHGFHMVPRRGCTYMSPRKGQELKATSCGDVKHELICISDSQIHADDIERSCYFAEDIGSKDYFIVLIIALVILAIIGCALTSVWRRRLHMNLKDLDINQVEGSMNQRQHQNPLENNELSLQSTDSYSANGEEFPTYNHTTTYIAKQENS